MSSNDKQVRVRFAPSPTGYLHIGSARTAFFNWLYAKKNQGELILRIEDTDILRHVEDSLQSLTDSLKWLGLDWDEGYESGGDLGPYRQSQRKEMYVRYAEQLVQQSKAYRCFCTPETLKQKRESLEKEGKTFKYDRHCLKLTDEEIERKISQEMPYALRLRLPDDQIISFKDIVYGEISVNTENLDDFVILRSNGLPTYNFSAAVDDALMKITDVIRGEDHLSNTPKQILIYMLLGFTIPQFTHLPMILGSDGQKLSKRHGSVAIEAYRDQGILPEAILNYLALLGWSPEQEQDMFTVKQLLKDFDLKDINKKPARFDYEKLIWINSCWIRSLDTDQLASMIARKVKESIDSQQALAGWDTGLDEKCTQIAPLIRERIKTLNEIPDWVFPYFTTVSYTPESLSFFDLKKVDAPLVLEETIKIFAGMQDFDSQEIEQALRLKSETMDCSFRNYISVIRMALWGTKVSPPLFKTMEILGRDLTLHRLNNYLKALKARA
ncbi:MAG: glutamate--tRNA ligase [Actinomycetia bacterium]|nr:glutamate--tRNA ligase [Actinomycetes bacterium]